MRGHVRKRGAKWAVVVDVGRGADGRRRQKWHSGYATKREAVSAVNEIVGKLEGGAYIAPKKETVAQFLRRWLDAVRVTIRPATWSTYRTIAEVHIIPRVGNVPLQRLTAAQLNTMYADLLASGRVGRTKDGAERGPLAPRTVQYVHAVIRKALGDGVKWQDLARNVAQQANPPRQSPREMSVWAADELRAFLDHVAGDRLEAAFVLSATTGMRRGEVLGLRWRDVDLDAGRAAVVQTVISVNSKVQFSTPKTARGRRSVALDPVTTAAVRAHKARQLQERLALGLGRSGPDHLVFAQKDGSPVDPGYYSGRFQTLSRAAGLPRIRMHDLRHSHATLALGAGIPAKVVSDRLGHANIAITLDTYSHVLPALQEEAAGKVAALIYGAS
ncbi:MAG: tyrosine-type recombinase/integrase [Dehalococcoidia bacterium]